MLLLFFSPTEILRDWAIKRTQIPSKCVKKWFPSRIFGDFSFGTKAVGKLIPLLLGTLTPTGDCFTHTCTHTPPAVCAMYYEGCLLPQSRRKCLCWVPLGWASGWHSGSSTQGVRGGQTGGNRCLRCASRDSVCTQSPSIPKSTDDNPGNPRMRAPLFRKGKLPALLMTRFWLLCRPIKWHWSSGLLPWIRQPRGFWEFLRSWSRSTGEALEPAPSTASSLSCSSHSWTSRTHDDLALWLSKHFHITSQVVILQISVWTKLGGCMIPFFQGGHWGTEMKWAVQGEVKFSCLMRGTKLGLTPIGSYPNTFSLVSQDKWTLYVIIYKNNSTNNNTFINESTVFYRYHSETSACNISLNHHSSLII